jgi:NAD(P)-dependent dehydrogenase (short-subunit alcohol dehydrogenase family)
MRRQAVDLTGRNVLITGGSRGIGYATAAACLRAGARVTIAARTAMTVQDAVDRLRGQELGDVEGVCCDVSDLVGVDAAIAHAESSFGRIHGLVHAAAVLSPIGPVIDVEPEEWLDTVRVNLFGTFLVVRQVARHMVQHGGGRMVCLSGGGASGPFPNFTAYASSKVAVVRFCETVAAELAPLGVEVNCLAPGFVATRMHEQTLIAGERAGREYLESTKAQLDSGGVPSEVAADAAAFLLSEGAAGITAKFVSAPHDDVRNWPEHLPELEGSDLFTLRRVLPRDRSRDWQ